MTEVKPFYEVIDHKLHINMHPGQSNVWQQDTRIICLLCGAQYGKTSFGPPWLAREMHSCGNGDYLAVTATFPLLRLKMLPELIKYFVTFSQWGTWKAGEKVFESHEKDHGAPAQRIIVGSATSPESLESATAKAAWLDECGQHQFTREAWEAIQRRLAINQGRVLMTTTPYEFGWFKTEIYDRWKDGDMDISVIQGDSIDNPAFPKEEYYRQKGLLPPWRFRMAYQGQFERPAGLIYDAFNEDICKIPRFVLPSHWPRYVGHDFGPNNTAAVWYAQDTGSADGKTSGTGFLYVYRDYHAGGLSNFDHVQKWKNLSAGENIRLRVGGAHAETGFREACTAAGWPVAEPRERSVESGINLVYGWHQQNKLFVFDDVLKYLDEKNSYSRELDENYDPTEKIHNKSSYHLMDAERYIISNFGPERADMNEKVPVSYHNGSENGPQSDKLRRKKGNDPRRKFWPEYADADA